MYFRRDNAPTNGPSLSGSARGEQPNVIYLADHGSSRRQLQAEADQYQVTLLEAGLPVPGLVHLGVLRLQAATGVRAPELAHPTAGPGARVQACRRLALYLRDAGNWTQEK